MNQRISRRDLRLLILCGVLTAGSLWFGARHFKRVFPEAAVDFKVTRSQARGIGEDILTRLGWDASGYRHASVFGQDGAARVYLERTVGLERTNDLVGKGVQVWGWRNRWYTPGKTEEFGVEVSPSGELVGLNHAVEETRSGARLDADQARLIALDFLDRYKKICPDDLDSMEVRSEEMPGTARTDHIFTWRNRRLSMGEAAYLHQVTIQGGQLGAYREFLKVPEEFSRAYQRSRTRHRVAGDVVNVFVMLLMAGMLFTAISRGWRRDLRPRTALLYGGVACLLEFLSRLNGLPRAEYSFDTRASYGGFLAEQVLWALGAAVFSGVVIFLITLAAESVYRGGNPDRVRLGKLFSWRTAGTREFVVGAVVGYALAALFVAYQVAFYLVVERLGGWAPADIPYDNILNTRFPWTAVLFLGFFPAVSEEFAARVFAVPVLAALLRSRAAALVLPGALWGLAHAGYPNEPWFVRGVELGLFGVLLGLVLLRFGVVPLLVWHYTVDAGYASMLLLRSDHAYFRISALAATGLLAVPLLLGVVSYVRRRGFADPGSLSNRADTAPCPAAAPARVGETTLPELPSRCPGAGLVTALGAVALAAVALLWFAPRQIAGGRSLFGVSREDAGRTAALLVIDLGDDPAAYRMTVVAAKPQFGELEMKYILSQPEGGVSHLNEVLHGEGGGCAWSVRFFRWGQAAEYTIRVDGRTGAIAGFQYDLPEDAAGARLEQDEARRVGVEFLKGLGFDTAGFTPAGAWSKDRSNRRDHGFQFDSPPIVGRARFRVGVGIAGDRVNALTRTMRVPEDWARGFFRRTAWKSVLGVFPSVFLGILAGIGAFLLLRALGRKSITWRFVHAPAAVLVGSSVLHVVNSLPARIARYDTVYSQGAFFTRVAMEDLARILGFWIFSYLLLAAIQAAAPQSVALARADNRRRLGAHALVAALFAVCLIFILRQWVLPFAVELFPAAAHAPRIEMPRFLDTWLPALSLPYFVLSRSLVVCAVAAVAGCLLGRAIRGRAVRAELFVLACVALSGSWASTPAEFAMGLGRALFLVGGAAAVAAWVFRDNWLAYPVAAVLTFGLTAAQGLLGQPSLFLRLNGAAGAFGVAAFVAWACFAAPRAGGGRTAPQLKSEDGASAGRGNGRIHHPW